MPRDIAGESRRVTLRDVAQRLGLSHTTVSRALNAVEDPFISEATRLRVRTMAQTMGYRPNHAARTLATGRTGLVALWLWSMREPGSYHAAVGRAMHRQAMARHYQLLIDPIAPGPDRDARLRGFDRWNVDGIVAHEASPAIAGQIENGVRPPVPLVSTGSFFLVEGVDQVRVDLAEGARAAVRHLVEGGRRRLLYVTDDLPDREDDARYLAFTDVLGEAGLEPHFLDVMASRAQVRASVRAYVERHGAPDAMFCHNDDFALGAYRGLCDLGVRVPEDVALVGCDGIEDCEYLEVPITSIVQPLGEMCEAAFDMLQRRIEEPHRPLQSQTLPARLVVRESSQEIPRNKID